MAAYCGGRARNTRFGRIRRPATLKPFPAMGKSPTSWQRESVSQALDPRSARVESVKSLGDPPAIAFAVEVNRKIRAPSTVKEPAGVRSAAVPWRPSPRQTKPETRTTPRAARSGRRFCRERRLPGSMLRARRGGKLPPRGLGARARQLRYVCRRLYPCRIFIWIPTKWIL